MPNIPNPSLDSHQVIEYKSPETLGEYTGEVVSALQNTLERLKNLHLEDADRKKVYQDVLDTLPDNLYQNASPDPADEKNVPTEGRTSWERAFLQDEVRPNCTWGRNMFHILKLHENGYTYEGLSQLTRRTLSYAGYHVDKKLIRPRQDAFVADKFYHSEVDKEFIKLFKERVVQIEESRKGEVENYNAGIGGAIDDLYTPIGGADHWEPAPLNNPSLSVNAVGQREAVTMIETKEFPEDFARMQKEVLMRGWEGLVRSSLDISNSNSNSNSTFAQSLEDKKNDLKRAIILAKAKETNTKAELDAATSANNDAETKAQEYLKAEDERKEAEAKLEQFNKQLEELEYKRKCIEEDLDARQKLMETRLRMESRGALSAQEKNEVEGLFADEKEIMEDVEARLQEIGITPRDFFEEVKNSSYPTQARGVYAFIRDTMEMVRRDCSEQKPNSLETRMTNGEFLEHIKMTDVRMQFLMTHREYIEDVLDTFAPECVEYAKAKLWFRHNISASGCEIKEALGESLSDKDLEEEAKVHYALAKVEHPLLYGSVDAYKQREPLPGTVTKFLQDKRQAIHDSIAGFGSWEGHAVIGSMLGKLTGLAVMKTAKISSYLVGGILQRGGDYLFRRPGRYLAQSLTDNNLWPLYPLWPFMKLWQGVGYMTEGLGTKVDDHITHGMLSRENELRVRHALGFAGEYAGKYGARATGYAVDKGVEAAVDGAAYKRITNYEQAEDAFTQLKSGLGSAARVELRQHIAPKKAGSVDPSTVLTRIKEEKGTLASELIRRSRPTPQPETPPAEGETPKPTPVERFRTGWEAKLKEEAERQKREELAEKKREEKRRKQQQWKRSA